MQAVAPFASLEQRHADEAAGQQQRRQRGRRRRDAADSGTLPGQLPTLGPSQLMKALREASTSRQTAQLLVEHREVAGARHLIEVSTGCMRGRM